MGEGYHTEKTDTPFGPMDINVENEGLRLDIDLSQTGTEDAIDHVSTDAFVDETPRVMLPDWKDLSRAWTDKPSRRPDLPLTVIEHDVDMEDMADRVVANLKEVDDYVNADPARKFEMSWGAAVYGLFVESQRYEHDEAWLAEKSTQLADTIAEQTKTDRKFVGENLKEIWRHLAAAKTPDAYFTWLQSGMPDSKEMES